MDFTYTAEQEALRDTVRSLLGRHAGSERVRAADGFDRPLWTKLAGELGVAGLLLGEEHGGAGASLVEAGIVLEETGRALAPVPCLSTVTAVAALSVDVLPDSLRGLAAGDVVATLALAEPTVGLDPSAWTCTARRDGDSWALDGVKTHVLDGQVADVLLVAARHGGDLVLFAVPARAVGRTEHDTLDLTRRQATVVLRGAPATPVGSATAALDLWWAALAVESVGVARAALAATVGHLRTRHQFGVPLAHFQALRHRVADLAVAVESAASSAWYALRVAGTAEFPVVAPLAALVATRAAATVAAETVQLHGGIGFTWEHDAHLYLRRATTSRLLAGEEAALRRVVGTRAGLIRAR